MEPDFELMNRCCRDDRKAHYELYKMCYPALYSICKRYYNNKEDAMASLNMAFLKMIRGMKQYLGRQPGPPFALWARRITINQVVDDFRKNKKHLTVFESMEPMENGTLQLPDDSFFRKQNLEHLRAVIDSLPHMPKTIFNLYEVDGYRHDEIADMFGISVNTSKVHLHHARKKLREILRNENNVMYKPQNKIVHE